MNAFSIAHSLGRKFVMNKPERCTLSIRLANSLRNLVITAIIDRLVIWKKGQAAQTIDLPSHKVTENRRIWNTYDWSKRGEEWTLDAKLYKGIDPDKWKETVINEMMLKYIKNGSTILEIGIGAGRWSEVLQRVGGRVILTDISQKCIEICKDRFAYAHNIEYHLIEERLDFINDNTIDGIWSYDVFVHINPSDIEKYISDFGRILKPGAYAIIHHSNMDLREKSTREKISNVTKGLRSYMSASVFEKWIQRYGMQIIEQNYTLSHIPGDVISVFTKP